MANAKARATQPDDKRESGMPGGGQGRNDQVEPTGIYPVSEMGGASPDAKVHGEESFGQGDRGAAGYQDAGSSGIIPDEKLKGGDNG